MSNKIYLHIRSNIWGILALWVSLGGVAWATATIGASDIRDNAVHSNHIRNGDVKTADLDDDAVTGPKVDEPSLDKSVLQSRIASGCPSGQAIASVAQSGSPTCTSTGAGGATRINFSAGSCTNGSPCSSNIFSAGGWTLNASCAANGFYGAVTFTVTSPAGGTTNYGWVQQEGTEASEPVHGGFPGSGSFTGVGWGIYGVGAVGTIILNSPGQTISIPFEMYGVGQSSGYCEIFGTATTA